MAPKRKGSEDASPPQPNDAAERIELTIPARPEYLVVVRLAAAGIAGRTSLSFDDIEDLKIAVSEACTAAILAGGRQVHVRFDVAADRLDVRVADGAARAGPPSQERELGLFLMRCLMDDVRTETDGPQQVISMSKRFQQ